VRGRVVERFDGRARYAVAHNSREGVDRNVVHRRRAGVDRDDGGPSLTDASTRARLADGALLLAGGALLASAFLPWVRHGPGHTLHGHALVDAVVALGNTVPGLSAARLTVLWYLIPAAGALTWVALGVVGPGSVATRIVTIAGLVAAIGAFVAFGRALGFESLGSGAFVALAGGLVGVAGAFVAPSRSR
jgi:hypothetical protein